MTYLINGLDFWNLNQVCLFFPSVLALGPAPCWNTPRLAAVLFEVFTQKEVVTGVAWKSNASLSGNDKNA